MYVSLHWPAFITNLFPSPEIHVLPAISCVFQYWCGSCAWWATAGLYTTFQDTSPLITLSISSAELPQSYSNSFFPSVSNYGIHLHWEHIESTEFKLTVIHIIIIIIISGLLEGPGSKWTDTLQTCTIIMHFCTGVRECAWILIKWGLPWSSLKTLVDCRYWTPLTAWFHFDPGCRRISSCILSDYPFQA